MSMPSLSNAKWVVINHRSFWARRNVAGTTQRRRQLSALVELHCDGWDAARHGELFTTMPAYMTDLVAWVTGPSAADSTPQRFLFNGLWVVDDISVSYGEKMATVDMTLWRQYGSWEAVPDWET